MYRLYLYEMSLCNSAVYNAYNQNKEHKVHFNIYIQWFWFLKISVNTKKNHIYICIYGMPCDDQYMHTFYNAKIKVIQHLSHIVIKLKEKGKSQTERIPRRRTSSHVNGCWELQWPKGSGLTVPLCTEDAISDDHKTGFGARMRVQNPSREGSEIMSGRQMNK